MMELNRTAPWPEIKLDKAKINIRAVVTVHWDIADSPGREKKPSKFLAHDSGLRGMI